MPFFTWSFRGHSRLCTEQTTPCECPITRYTRCDTPDIDDSFKHETPIPVDQQVHQKAPPSSRGAKHRRRRGGCFSAIPKRTQSCLVASESPSSTMRWPLFFSLGPKKISSSFLIKFLLDYQEYNRISTSIDTGGYCFFICIFLGIFAHRVVESLLTLSAEKQI